MASSNTNKVLALSFGKALTSVIGLLSGLILARALTVNEYATYRQTILVYSFLIPVLTLGLPEAIYYFLGGDKSRNRALLNENLILLFIMGGIFALFLLLGGNILWANRFSNPELEHTLKVFAPYAILVLPLGTISAVFVIKEKIKTLTVFNILSRLFLFICIVVTVLLYAQAYSLIIAEVLSAAVVLFVMIFMLYKLIPSDGSRISFKNMWVMLKFSIPLGFSAVLGTLSIQLDQLIVSSMCSPGEYAVYANGTFEIPVIGMVTGSIATIILVEMRKSIADGKVNDALELFRKAALKSSPILIPLMFYLLIMASQFIEVVFSSKYINSIDPFRVYLLMLPARIVYYGSALLAFGLTRVILFRSALSLAFNAILSIILVHFIGYMGAIISFIIVLYFWDVSYNFRILSNKFECKWHELLPLKEIGKIILISAICSIFIVPFTILKMNNILSLIISSVIFFPAAIYLLQKFKLIEFSWDTIKGSKIWGKFRK